jgi:anti-sigma factor ChrR (cupin superfamily)
MHEHTALEQSWVIQGRLVDEEGEVTAGNYVWRPGGSRHVARAPEGCLVLGFFLKPNKFL